MRTTLDLDDKILDAARRRAADQGTTLTTFVEQALAAALPGIDIADRDSLFDAMDGRR